MQQLTPHYFFDFPFSDIAGNVCDALRILYHGSLEGPFGQKMNEWVDLGQLDVIKIPAIHRLFSPASDEYVYDLGFYDKSISDSLWDEEKRQKQAELRALTRRVLFNTQKSHLARRIMDNLFIKPGNHPIYFAKYEGVIHPDHYVPLSYHAQLSKRFDAYIMRSNRDFPLVRSLCRAQGLHLDKRRFSRESPLSTNRPIVTYTLMRQGGP
jgi:hypothetical protein